MTCPVTSKKAYTFRGVASLAAQAVEAIFGDVHPYVCRSCGTYHLGHHSAVAVILRWDEMRREVAARTPGNLGLAVAR